VGNDDEMSGGLNSVLSDGGGSDEALVVSEQAFDFGKSRWVRRS
jgi:hypothetical protein